MSTWDYNCPKFVDFVNFEDENSAEGEDYFDVDHECYYSDDHLFKKQASPVLKSNMQSADKTEQNSEPQDRKDGTKLQVPENLSETIVYGVSDPPCNLPEKKQLLNARRASLRLQKKLEEEEEKRELGEVVPKKKKLGTQRSVASPLILNRSARQLRNRSLNRSMSAPRAAHPAGTRKRHSSEGCTASDRKEESKKSKKTARVKVQPFRFATDSRIKGPDADAKANLQKRKRPTNEPTKFISLAEQILAFHNQIPDRFKSESHHRSLQHISPPKGLTRPKMPRLRTSLRSRATHVKGQQELEQEEVEKMENYKFQAKPFNPRVMIHTLGIPMVKSKPPTEAKDVQLATDKRAAVWKKPEPEEVFRFKANPAPKIRPVRVRPVSTAPVTSAKSPAFALKLRSAAWEKHQEEMLAKEALKKTPKVRKSEAVLPSQSFVKRPTIPVPFSFDAADKRRWAKKEAKIKEMLQEENAQHVFHANPMPSPSATFLLQKGLIQGTQPDPFRLALEVRGQKWAEQWKQKLDEELQQKKEATIFKSQPADVLDKEPFRPEKPLKPLTETTNIKLHTEKRALDREQYDEKRRQHEGAMERLKLEREAQQEEQENLQILELRSKSVHRAQPAPNFDYCVPIKPSDKPLTQPHSPRFSTRFAKLSKN